MHPYELLPTILGNDQCSHSDGMPGSLLQYRIPMERQHKAKLPLPAPEGLHSHILALYSVAAAQPDLALASSWSNQATMSAATSWMTSRLVTDAFEPQPKLAGPCSHAGSCANCMWPAARGYRGDPCPAAATRSCHAHMPRHSLLHSTRA